MSKKAKATLIVTLCNNDRVRVSLSKRDGSGNVGYAENWQEVEQALETVKPASAKRVAQALAVGGGSEAVSAKPPYPEMLTRICDPLTSTATKERLLEVLRALAGADAEEANDVLRFASNAVNTLARMPKIPKPPEVEAQGKQPTIWDLANKALDIRWQLVRQGLDG